MPQKADIGERRTNRRIDRPTRLQLEGLAAATTGRFVTGLTVASGATTVI
jgi:hypothetical protein